MRDFEVVAGSTAGTTHRLSGRNNHDAYLLTINDSYLVGIVADGCGSRAHSEVGSNLAVRILTRALIKELEWGWSPNIESARKRMGNEIDLLVSAMGSNRERFDLISEYFLFTVVGFFIGAGFSQFFMLGDGVISINGEVDEVQYNDNRPPYLAYDLLDRGATIPWTQRVGIPSEDVQSFLIGSDGVAQLTAAEGQSLPGNASQCVRPLSALWEEDHFYKNADNVNRYLNLANSAKVHLDREKGELVRRNGLLHDDTTIIVGRRKPIPEQGDENSTS